MADKESKGLFSFLKKNDDYEDEYDYDDEEVEDGYDEMTPLPKYQTGGKVVNLGQSMASGVNSQVKVMIYEPASYDEDAPAIVDSLKAKKVCIVNLESVNDPEIAKTIFDFLNGAIYAMDGRIKKISKGIFLLAPENTDIDGNIKKELESKGFFRWQ
ncbi:cell division protein SepF [Proteocatella sphenisci]|uniref:cell division protein SepF n=1 Tax=Proteocatella sphenisci TaxID=181070 RepID=UPI00048A4E5A|nr:cell division protein SepF [Proteocatella sphenisci]